MCKANRTASDGLMHYGPTHTKDLRAQNPRDRRRHGGCLVGNEELMLGGCQAEICRDVVL